MTTSRIALLLVLSGAIFLEGVDVSMMNVALPSIRAELDLTTGALQLDGERVRARLRRFRPARRARRGPARPAADVPGLARRVRRLLRPGRDRDRGGSSSSPVSRPASPPRSWRPPVFRSSRRASPRARAQPGAPESTRVRRPPASRSALSSAACSPRSGGGGCSSPRSSWPHGRWRRRRLVPRGDRPRRAALRPGRRGHLTGAMITLVFAVVRRRTPTWPYGPGLAGSRADHRFRRDRATVGGATRAARHPALGPLVRANVGAMLFVGAFIAFQFVVVLYLQAARLVVGADRARAAGGQHRRHTRADAHAAAGEALRQAPVIGAGWPRHRRLRALPAGRSGLDVPADAADDPSGGRGFALTYGTLTIVATDGVAEAEQGLASGLQYASLQFGAAVGLVGVTAVNVAATNGSSQAALLDGFQQAALFVPVAAVVLGLVVTATAPATRGCGGRPSFEHARAPEKAPDRVPRPVPVPRRSSYAVAPVPAGAAAPAYASIFSIRQGGAAHIEVDRASGITKEHVTFANDNTVCLDGLKNEPRNVRVTSGSRPRTATVFLRLHRPAGCDRGRRADAGR